MGNAQTLEPLVHYYEEPMALDVPQPLPSVGRIVHFVDLSLRHFAAIVVGCDQGDADLYVFPTRDHMSHVVQMIPYSEQPRPFTWHYPEESAATP